MTQYFNFAFLYTIRKLFLFQPWGFIQSHFANGMLLDGTASTSVLWFVWLRRKSGGIVAGFVGLQPSKVWCRHLDPI